MTDPKTLWRQLLGDPPSDEQWTVWATLHTPEVITQAIAKTAGKNLSLGKTMSLNYKTAFASKVMLVASQRNAEHAANRERLRQEMEGR